MNFKNIYIGQLIKTKVVENGIEMSRICKFMKSTDEDTAQMYEAKSLDCEILLRWCKLLEFDFFRIYTNHLILYSPPSKPDNITKKVSSKLPQFRKNIYTMEIIDFILEQISSKKMTKIEVMGKYKIPKTTLCKWISKYKN